MNIKKNWLIPLILTLAGGAALLQGKLSAPVATETPAEAPTQAYEGCAYVWASQAAPDLSETFSALVKELDSRAQARASFFGEDCVYADGRREFHAMETDFYVRLPVADLTDEEAMGNWMARVLPVVLSLPQDNNGFVEFWFEKSETENAVARVPLQTYKAEAQGKSGAELYALFAVR